MTSSKETPPISETPETTENTTPTDTQTPPTDDATTIENLRAALARSQADYQNLVMRMERDKMDMMFFLSSKVLLPLLTQIDHLERAIATKADVTGDSFVDGIRQVYTGFSKYLEDQGVAAFDSIGKEVDPERHDVLSQEPGPSGEITQEFERGYLLGTRVLRHAKVIAGSGE